MIMTAHLRSLRPALLPQHGLGRSLPWVWAFIGAVSVAMSTDCAQAQELAADEAVPDGKELVREAWRAVSEQYYDPAFGGVNWVDIGDEYLSRSYASLDEAYAAIREMLARLNNPATRFLNPEQAATLIAEFNGTLGEGTGLIGLLCVDTDQETNRIVIVTPLPDTPAARAGLRTGDIIDSLDGRDVNGMDLAATMSALRGPSGSSVEVGVLRNGKAKTVNIERTAAGQVTPVVTRTLEYDGVMVAYIGLRLFNQESPQRFLDFVRRYEREGVSAYVLDLRNNPGGFVPSVQQIAGALIGAKPIASLRTRDGIQELAAQGDQLTRAKLVVLINEGTASAAEVLASALQHYERGKLLGATTFGKGLAHGFTQLEDGSAVMPTYGRLITLDGVDVLTNGVTPDIQVQAADHPAVDPGLEAATRQDEQFMRAVRYVTGVAEGGM